MYAERIAPADSARLDALLHAHRIPRAEAEAWLRRSFRWAYPDGVPWESIRRRHAELLERDFVPLALGAREERARLTEAARQYALAQGWDGSDWKALARMAAETARSAAEAAATAQYKDGFADERELAAARARARLAQGLRDLLFS